MNRVSVRVPAKINLHLGVGPLRADGYHSLATLYQAVSLHDQVTVERADPGSGISLHIEGSFVEQVPADRSNLAVRAIEEVAARCGVAPDVQLTIGKAIPVAAGLAGGSADAAAALVAADLIFGAELDRDDLLAIAARLGSDVPFALTGGTAIGLGRGELLTPALTRGTFHWVLVSSGGAGLSTPAVFAELDRLRAAAGGADSGEPEVPAAVMQALLAHDPLTLGRALGNDLQEAALALRPQLRTRIDIAVDYGALGAIISGSGPTVALLVRDEEHALDLTVALASHGIADPMFRVTGPVPGARVVEAD